MQKALSRSHVAVQSSPSDDSSSFVPSFSRERIRDSLHAGKSSRISLTAAYSIEEGGGEGEKLLIGRMDSRSRLRTLHAYENYGQSSDSSSSTRASTRKLPTVFRSNIFTLCCGSRARPFSCKPPRISKKRDSETIGERNILKKKEERNLSNLSRESKNLGSLDPSNRESKFIRTI